MTSLVSGNSGPVGRGYRAPERSAIPIHNGHQSHGQGNSYQTHLNHDEHVEAIQKGREYLVEAGFSTRVIDNKRRVTSYRDHLSKDNLCQYLNTSKVKS